MRVLTFATLVIGIGTTALLVAWQGFGTVAAAVAALGTGMYLLPVIYAPHLIGAAASWRLMLPQDARPSFGTFLRAVWIGISVEAIVPAASLGAELVKARLLVRAGLSLRRAVPSAVVDVTVQGFVIAVWALIGLGVLLATPTESLLKWGAAIGAAIILFGVALFLTAQRMCLFGRLTRVVVKLARQDRWQKLLQGAADVDDTLNAYYAEPWRVFLAVAIRCCSRAMLAVELYLAASWMNFPITALSACMLLGLVGALRAATIVVPGGWGVQEGGYIVLGGVIGLPPEAMLALSLVTRARELVIGLPALIVWQYLEGKTLGVLHRQRRGQR